ncbi:MAG: hypothetical protein LBQ66_11830 [Planctomycetaceae bacterium]|nr:hypothetical protein [Planctomycetaceae bacterium]
MAQKLRFTNTPKPHFHLNFQTRQPLAKGACPYNANVFWFWAIEILVRVGDPVVGLRRRYSPRKPGGRLPTLHLPIRFGTPFKLLWCYYTQRRAGRPRSSPFPLRGNFFLCREAANFCGITRRDARVPIRAASR